VPKVPFQRTAAPRQPEHAVDGNDPGFVRSGRTFDRWMRFESRSAF
jgi:hypothetical protein